LLKNSKVLLLLSINFNQFEKFDIVENIKLFYGVLTEVVDFIKFWVLLLETHDSKDELEQDLMKGLKVGIRVQILDYPVVEVIIGVILLL
jgi:hypothetical protein